MVVKSACLRSFLFVGRGGPKSRKLGQGIVKHVPASLGGEIFGYMALGRPRKLTDTEVAVEREGAKINLMLADNVDRLHYLGIYERRLRDDFLSGTGSGDLVIDVGANIGIYTLAAAARGASVIAFEPVPGTAARLVRNVEMNDGFSDRVKLVQAAVSDASGEATLYGYDFETNSSEASFRREAGANQITVRKVTLDEALADTQPAGGVRIKLDIEGHELQALRGASETFARLHPDRVAVEIVNPFLRTGGLSGEAILDWMEERGYRAACSYTLYPHRGPRPVTRPLGRRFSETVIFTR